MPSTRGTITKENIEIARQKLLEAIFSELPDDRYVGREAIRQLMSTLVAARERGFSFERIAQRLHLDITPSTLRTYYFQLKSDAEVAAQTVQHRRKVARAREAIAREVLEKHIEHANELVSRRALQTQAAPRLVDAFKTNEGETVTYVAVQEPVEPSRNEENLGTETTRPASPAAVPSSPSAPAALQFYSERTEAPAVVSEKYTARDLVSRDSLAIASPADEAANMAMTLTAIADASLATDERTELLEDVELRAGDLVYYVSGKPFEGFLAQRQVFLLRTVGRLIAPTKTRTSKDFVKMPENL